MNKPPNSPIGRHLIAEIRDLGAARLRDADDLMDALEAALKTHEHQVLGRNQHRFTSGGAGFSGVFLLAESHASLHSYPELNYLAFDLFSCGTTPPQRVLKDFVSRIGGRVETERTMNRGPHTDSCELELIAVLEDGSTPERPGTFAEFPEQVRQAMIGLYEREGFDAPWLGYIAFEGETPVGSCGFKSPPRDGRIEIAYVTFPPFEGAGRASLMAKKLVALATETNPDVEVFAQTLPSNAASIRILEKLGFVHEREFTHPEDGLIIEWVRPE